MSQTVTAVIVSRYWIAQTDANAAYWATEATDKAVLLPNGEGCGVVKEAWITEEGDVMAEVVLDPSVYDQAFENFVTSGIA